MTGILFASVEEGRAFLERYERGRFDDLTEGDWHHDDLIAVGITGSGKIKSTLRTERFLRTYKVDRIIEAGLCTSLKPQRAIGTVVTIDQVFEGDRIELAAPSYPRMPLEVLDEEITSGTLVTQDHLVGSGEEQTYWQRIADYIDSSGYAVAYVAATHGVPTAIIKVVSGHLQKNESDVRTTRSRSGDALATYLIDRIARLSA